MIAWGREALGVALIGAAIIGLVLPVVPTVPFLIGAAALLGRDHRLIRPLVGAIDRWRGARSATAPKR